MAVFVLPVNCCLNPIIYTFVTPEFNTIIKRLPCFQVSAGAKALRQIAKSKTDEDDEGIVMSAFIERNGSTKSDPTSVPSV